MRNFHRLAVGLDIIPLMDAIQRHEGLWNQHTLRTTHPMTPHKQVDDIWIRFNDLDEFLRTGDASSVVDQHESIWYEAANVLPVRPFVFDLMRRVEAERLGRVLITRLSPGGHIEPHVDSGDHAAYYDRYHFCLKGLPGSLFRCGNEEVQMQTGEVWWFQNSVEHEVLNNSTDDRIHMIVDLKIR